MMRNDHSCTLKARLMMSLIVLPLCAMETMAQSYGGPLTMEGLHQHNNQSAAARARGAVTIAGKADVGLMFVNPSAISALDGLTFSVAGFRGTQDLRQTQEFAPVRYYPNLSLLLEGLTDQIPDPDPELVGFTPGDSVQRGFDDIPPNWSRSRTSSLPLHALLAVPISVGGLRASAGLGFVQYANLDHYYQNNNVLDPAVLSPRPLPTLRPTDDNPVLVNWYGSSRSREGSIHGYGLALAGHIARYNLTLGVSGLLLRGESDDVEERVQRGRLTFFANEFRADSSGGTITRTGTSTFTGREFALSSTLTGTFVSVGFVVRTPTKFTRTFETETSGDTTSTPFIGAMDGEDRLELPWRGSIGMLLRPREELRIGLEYVYRPYTSATFTSSSDVETSPWYSSSLVRFGIEYDLFRWLALRGGLRGEADVFVPEGSPIDADPVSYRVFSAGVGLKYMGVKWDVTYETSDMKYEDIWGSALSRNADVRHTIITAVSYTIR